MRDQIFKDGIEEIASLNAIFLIGFGYLIACFSKTLAGGYYIFLFVSTIFIIIIKKIKKKRRAKKNG